jgi:ribosomal protein L7Ae-like RNA K-turn-binding protein
MDPRARGRLAGLIGLGARARGIVVGVEQVRAAAKRDALALALVAPDCSAHARDKVVPLLEARRIEWREPLGAEALGAAVGRPAVSALGVTDPALARGMRQVMDGAPATEPRRMRTRRSA